MLLNIDFSKLLVDYLPTMLRKPKLMAWLECLIKPLKQLYSSFSDHVLLSRVQLAYTSQTMAFESALNDLFDPAFRRITIDNNPAALPETLLFDTGDNEPDILLFDTGENEPDLLLYDTEEYAVPLGFRVNTPTSLKSQEKALRAFIEKIKFSHIRYEINYQ